MRSSDTKTLAYQNSQKMFHERGYIHRNDPGDFVDQEYKPKKQRRPPQFKYCKLSKDQLVALKTYLEPDLKVKMITITELFDTIPPEMVTDKDGSIMTEMTFRRLYAKFRNEILTDKDELKNKIIEFKNAGFSADEICEKMRNVMRPQYLRPILEECGFGRQKSKASIVREMLAEGMSYQAINKKHPDISVRYARELDALMKKGKK